ncbi:hypothetical protein NDU88_004681 [Pleurodeles waltl]|uniref:Uncharacterized protein n=1 Tax=Pleurodeles waltl TaxID=8319 RepID=A0AAV7W9T0_PLEWA|nr:hypothetical protein NDU88_004681 [Pleurodeles waltl]
MWFLKVVADSKVIAGTHNQKLLLPKAATNFKVGTIVSYQSTAASQHSSYRICHKMILEYIKEHVAVDFNRSLSAAIVSLQRLHAYSQCLGDAYSQCFGNALFLRTQYAQECVRATLSSVSIHFLVALKSHHRLSWRHEHADGRPRSFPLSWRHIYASRLVKTCLCLALGARAQFQFLRSIKPKIVITIILADHSPAILEMRSSSSVPNVVPDRERPVSRNQGKRRHPVEASDT